MTLLEYDVDDTVGAGRARYFERFGFDTSTYGARWVDLGKIGPIPLGFPNSPGRQRAVPLHDLHHVLTGYAADWTGESEISAWEIGAGCGRYVAAWIINFGALTLGIIIAPRRTLHAFARGRRSRSLYLDGHGFTESMLEENLGQLRQKLGVADTDVKPTVLDAVLLAGASLVAPAIYLGPLALLAAAICTLL
jgi:hypothetical protein